MSRRWLSLALLLFSSCYRTNPNNCVVSAGVCSATEICDVTSERCVDPTTIACSSVDCPSGSFCDQATQHCAIEYGLSITSIDKTYIKSSGGEVVTIKGTGFVPESTVFFNGTGGAVSYISSTELRVTTPSRPSSTPCGRLPLRVANPGGVQKKVEGLFSYYVEGSKFTPSLLSTTLSQGAERLTLADLTLDGKNDLLVTSSSGFATVITGGSSGFEPGSSMFMSATATFATADLRPGRNFALTTDRNSPNLVAYRLMAGPALAYSITSIVSSASLESLALVDLNADNELDAIGLLTSGQIVNIIHDGSWGGVQGVTSYSPPSLPMAKAQSLVAGPYYGNKAIIASINRAASMVDLAEFNPSTRVFANTGMLQSTSAILAIFDGDFNGDGKKDLVVFHGNGSARIFYNDNGFSDSRIKDVSFGLSISGAAVGDLDCDGITDLIGLNGTGASPGLQFVTERSSSPAMFQLVNRIAPLAVAVGDIDGDLVPDLVVYSASNAPLNRIGITPM